jgi:inner membrane protease subunit 1
MPHVWHLVRQLYVGSTPLLRACRICLCGKFIHHLPKLLLTVLKVEGPSMEPTLGVRGDYVIENRLSYQLWPESITRGDIVTLRSPLDPFRSVSKRVIGLAGDVICVDPTGTKAPSTEHVIVPKGHVWLMGDNAAMSRDSRLYGPVSTALIQGKLVARVSSA